MPHPPGHARFVARATTCLFSLLLIAAPIAADDGAMAFDPEATGPRLTLADAIAIALAKNLQIRSAEHGEAAARWSKAQAIGGYLPTVEFATTFNYIDDDSVKRANEPTRMYQDLADALGIDLRTGQTVDNETYSSSIRVAQPLFNGGAEIGAIQVAAAGQREKAAASRDTVLETVRQVTGAYIGAVEARQVWRTAGRARALADETLRLTRARFENGELSRADVLRWEAESAKAEGAELESQNAYELAMISLVNILGVDLSTSYVLPEFREDVGPEWFAALLDRHQVEEERLAELADTVAAHPAVLRMRALEDGARARRLVALSDGLPKLNFGYVYGWETDQDVWLDGVRSWTATLQLQVPLFDSLRSTFGSLAARRLHQQARVAREDVERAYLQRALSARRSMLSAYLRIRAAGKSRAFAEENLAIVQTRQQVGEASNLEILDARLTFVQARTEYAHAVADFFRAEAEWQYLHARGDNPK